MSTIHLNLHHRICLIGLLVVAMASLPLAAYATDAPPSATNMTPAPAATASPEPTNTPTDSPSSVPQGLAGCKNDHQNVDYPLAVDCTLPATDSCPPPENVDTSVPCNSNPSDLNGNIRTYRDNSAHFKISDIVIHDTEGKGPEDGLINAALSEFQQPKNSVSIHYIVGRDGTVYQVLREKDIAYHAGNLWYNEHSIGIEHTGYEGSGFNSYTPAMYAASAKLVAYLTDKYDIPVDHAHIVSHGTIPSPYFAVGPNHLDPGPYFNFSAYFNSIDSPAPLPMKNVVTVENKKTSLQASEQPTDCNFFYLYNSPSTASEKFAIRENTESESDMSGSDAKIKSDLECAKPSTNPHDTRTFSVSNNVEAEMSYYYLNKKVDQAGSGNTMYEIWYATNTAPKGPFHTQLAWIAVPPGQAIEGEADRGAKVISVSGSDKASTARIFGRPTSANPSAYETPLPQGTDSYQLGDAPNGATFVSAYSIPEDVGGKLWYEINYNHRQAWVPAEEVTVKEVCSG